METFPHYKDFVKDGKVTVELVRALYGCIESALLWFESISEFLLSINYKQSKHDECLFFLEKDVIVGVYVDDLLIIAKSRAQIKTIETQLKSRFRDITVTYGTNHEYLGAHLDFSITGEVTMTMENKIRELLKDFNITNPYLLLLPII